MQFWKQRSLYSSARLQPESCTWLHAYNKKGWPRICLVSNAKSQTTFLPENPFCSILSVGCKSYLEYKLSLKNEFSFLLLLRHQNAINLLWKSTCKSGFLCVVISIFKFVTRKNSGMNENVGKNAIKCALKWAIYISLPTKIFASFYE